MPDTISVQGTKTKQELIFSNDRDYLQGQISEIRVYCLDEIYPTWKLSQIASRNIWLTFYVEYGEA